MIDALFEFTAQLIIGALNLIDALDLPVDLIAALTQYLSYGLYFIGSDMFLYVMASVTFWITVKLVLGIVLFIWRVLNGH